MVRFATVDSDESAGILLREMMELHIPTLLEYPDLIQRKDKRVYQDQAFGEVVAETSALLEKAALPAVMKLVTKSKPGSALDLGCGYGGYLAKIHHQFKGMKLTGVEKNRDVFNYARQRLPDDIQLLNQDLTAFLNNQNDSVDLVMVHNLLYYFPKDKRGALLKNISELTTPGGKISIITPIHHSQYGGMFTSAFNAFMTAHANLYPLPTIDELKELATISGLTMLSAEPIIKEGGWFIIIFTKN
ncbi:class I SAM-dependent methyltransferase [Salisediminibacterium beveridgei]|nr:class I SAM-dependent methyltransferase [Salisediminibacterium beveridgei]